MSAFCFSSRTIAGNCVKLADFFHFGRFMSQIGCFFLAPPPPPHLDDFSVRLIDFFSGATFFCQAYRGFFFISGATFFSGQHFILVFGKFEIVNPVHCY